jgi:outer membrane protein assembly factor BamB
MDSGGHDRQLDSMWPTKGHDIRRTRFSPSDPVDPSPTLRWQCDHQESRLYQRLTVDEESIFVSSAEGLLFAIDPDTGDVRWERELGQRLRTYPVVADERVFVGGLNGQLHAVSYSGEKIWDSDFSNSPSTIAVADGTVMVAGGGSISALTAATGEQQWTTTDLGDAASSLCIGSDTIFLGTDGYLRALNRATGDVEWRTEVGDVLFLTVTTDVVFAMTRMAHVFALDIDTGEIHWETQRRGTGTYDLAVGTDSIFAATDWHLSALDPDTGDIRWQFESPGHDEMSLPVVTAEELYIVSKREGLLALDPDTGREQWRMEFPDSEFGQPTIAEETLYVTSAGKVYCYSAGSSLSE